MRFHRDTDRAVHVLLRPQDQEDKHICLAKLIYGNWLVRH